MDTGTGIFFSVLLLVLLVRCEPESSGEDLGNFVRSFEKARIEAIQPKENDK